MCPAVLPDDLVIIPHDMEKVKCFYKYFLHKRKNCFFLQIVQFAHIRGAVCVGRRCHLIGGVLLPCRRFLIGVSTLFASIVALPIETNGKVCYNVTILYDRAVNHDKLCFKDDGT